MEKRKATAPAWFPGRRQVGLILPEVDSSRRPLAADRRDGLWKTKEVRQFVLPPNQRRDQRGMAVSWRKLRLCWTTNRIALIGSINPCQLPVRRSSTVKHRAKKPGWSLRPSAGLVCGPSPDRKHVAYHGRAREMVHSPRDWRAGRLSSTTNRAGVYQLLRAKKRPPSNGPCLVGRELAAQIPRLAGKQRPGKNQKPRGSWIVSLKGEG